MLNDLILKEFEDLKKAAALLKAALDKFKPYVLEKIYTSDELEYYDSLSFRFEKCVELNLSFFRSLEIFLYSKFSDTLRDRLLVVQKLGLIDTIDFWMEMRLLRNKIAHTYIPQEIKDIYDAIYQKSYTILKTIAKIEAFLARK